MPKRMEMLLEDFQDSFEYSDGHLIRVLDYRNRPIRQEVGHHDKKGYLKATFKGVNWFAHRIIFLLHHGYCPEFVDHINGIKDDNRIENLRVSDISTNHYNCKMPAHSKSGYKGVHKMKNGTGYQCRINYRGQRHFLGLFKDLDEAVEVIQLARDLCHGDFANHGATA